MRIAQVAPLYESVPPKLYGGTERVVSYLTEELVNQGHDVTLFASGDSVTKARLIPATPRALRLDAGSIDYIAHHILLLQKVASMSHQFDVIHYHIDYFHFPLSRQLRIPHVTTLHGRLDLPDLQPLYKEFGDMPVISISDDQRSPLSHANWLGTVHHGLPRNLYHGSVVEGEYFAFLGRISPEKRVDRAIEIAKKLQIPLRIAAKVDKADERYFEKEISSLLDHPLIEYIGEIGEKEKQDFLSNAIALLFPVDWPEPFGLVMIEAIACGTPVVAYARGSVPEIIQDNVTGFIVKGEEDALEAAKKVRFLDRKQVRGEFEKRFSADRMARDYVNFYEQLARPAYDRRYSAQQ